MNTSTQGSVVTFIIILIFALIATAAWFFGSQASNTETKEGILNTAKVKEYIIRDVKECTVLSFTCLDGEEKFFDDRGCGCTFTSELLSAP